MFTSAKIQKGLPFLYQIGFHYAFSPQQKSKNLESLDKKVQKWNKHQKMPVVTPQKQSHVQILCFPNVLRWYSLRTNFHCYFVIGGNMPLGDFVISPDL